MRNQLMEKYAKRTLTVLTKVALPLNGNVKKQAKQLMDSETETCVYISCSENSSD